MSSKDDSLASSIAAAEAATDRDPTQEQIDQGSYAMGRFKVKGLEIVIETPSGAFRRGKTKKGKPWSIKLSNSYGFIDGFKPSESDGDDIDVFVGSNLDSELVHIIDQNNPATGQYDEHKVVLFEVSEEDAVALYHRNYSKGWTGFRSCTALTWDQFKSWLMRGDTGTPMEGQLMSSFHKRASTGNKSDRFRCPENYEEIRKLGPDKDLKLMVGQNDWETGGWVWAGIHTVSLKRPACWIQIDHSNCPGCSGDSMDRDACKQHGRDVVDRWVEASGANPSLSDFVSSLARGLAGAAASGYCQYPELPDCVAVDLDGTLAYHDPDKPFDPDHVGRPMRKRVAQVADWILDGIDVIIFTARAADPEKIPPVLRWLKRNGLPHLQVTNEKTPNMGMFFDDRARPVPANKDQKFFVKAASDQYGDSLIGRGREGFVLDHQIDPEAVRKIFINIKGAPVADRVDIMRSHPELFPKILDSVDNEVTMERLYEIPPDKIPPRSFLQNPGAHSEELKKFTELMDFHRRVTALQNLPGNLSSITRHDSNVLDKGVGDHVVKDFRVRNNRTAHNIMQRADGSWVISDPVVWGLTTKAAAVLEFDGMDKSASFLAPKSSTGPEAIMDALADIDVDLLIEKTRQNRHSPIAAKRDAAVRMLGILDGLKRNEVQPHELMVRSVPVIPPAFRPITTIGEVLVPGDVNILYGDLFRIRKAYQESADVFGREGAGEARLALYDAMRAVSGHGESVNPKSRAKGVTGFLKSITGSNPKYSFFQRKLISKPRDNVSRGVIIPDPELSIDEVGLPEDHAWSSYGSFAMGRLVRGGMPEAEAIRAIRDRSAQARVALLAEMAERPTQYSRAPAWHKQNAVAGYAKIVDGDAIRISSMVATGLNADHDGDTINTYVPALPKSVAESKERLLPSKMLFSVKDPEKVLPVPKHEMIWGPYQANSRPSARVHKFADMASAVRAVEQGDVDPADDIEIPDI